MSSLNKVMIIGHLGKDPELRHTTTGKAVANFSVATSSHQNGKDVTEWHNVVVWDKLAENCNQYLAKGKMCYVEGRLTTRAWEKDGEKRFSTEIVANAVQFLSPRNESTAPTQAKRDEHIPSPADFAFSPVIAPMLESPEIPF